MPLLSPDYGLSLWHGHELLLGYGVAVVAGFILTAIPSWAETVALDGARLALLAFAWALGRLAMLLAPVLPDAFVAVADLAFFPLMGALILPGLWAARQKAYMAILVIISGFFYGNLLFHLGAMEGDLGAAQFGLQFFLYMLIVLYSIVGGLLTPIFSENELREAGWEGRITIKPALEAVALLSLLAYGATGLYMPGSPLAGLTAVIALAAQGLRMARWQGLRTRHQPLLWVMHLSYAWFLVSILLRAVGDLSGLVSDMAALHVFTVGAFGMMKIGFLTRVVLRHTGREVKPHEFMVMGFWFMFLGSAARLLAAVGVFPGLLMAASALLWAAPFIIYLWLYGACLWRPSLPRPATTGDEA